MIFTSFHNKAFGRKGIETCNVNLKSVSFADSVVGLQMVVQARFDSQMCSTHSAKFGVN